MRRKSKSFHQRFLKFVGYVVVIFVAATVIPVVVFKWIDPPFTSFMLQHHISSDIEPRYEWIDRQQISKHLAIAAVAAEDQKFPKHFGFDFTSIRSALEENLQGKSLRGASTITQQVAKNLFLWNGKNLIRKGVEAYFTVLIELLWDKARILEVYLNIAEMGDGIYGGQAASKFYYNKNVWEITLLEACKLVAILPNPKKYRLKPPSEYVSARALEIQQQVRQLGGFDYYMNN